MKTGQVGDCIDCARCVQVCPTGIDIRNGLQLECIGCSNCVDACDQVMTKIGRPKGLVRYDSLNGFLGKKHRWLRPRTILYTVLMFLGLGMLTLFLGRLQSVYVAVTRMTGAALFVTPEVVRNQFSVQYITKMNRETTFFLHVKNPPEGLNWVPNSKEPIVVPAQGNRESPLVITMDRKHYRGPMELELEINAEPGGAVVVKKVEFLGPDPRLMRDEPQQPKVAGEENQP